MAQSRNWPQAVTELMVARGEEVDATMDSEQVRNQLFNTPAEMIGANDDIQIL
jgi:hypothetical protein